MIEDADEIKLLTIGDSAVGKSWLLLRWANPENLKFLKNQSMPTVGIDYKMKNVTIDGKRFKIQVWDTAGQERFRTITQSYYRKASGILLVYDVTNRSSYTNIRSWIAQIQQFAEPSDIAKVLVGNKCDLVSSRAVSIQEGQTLANEFKMPFLETSALTDVNVDEAFTRLAREVKIKQAADLAVVKDPKKKIGISNSKPIEKAAIVASVATPKKTSSCSC